MDSDGDNDKIEVIELPQKQANRLLQVKMKESKHYILFASNDSLIACGTCGYKGSDDFTDLAKTQDGFVLYLGFINEFFKYRAGAIYLQKVEITHTDAQFTDKEIKRKREIYTSDTFGKVPLTEVTFDLKMLPEKK